MDDRATGRGSLPFFLEGSKVLGLSATYSSIDRQVRPSSGLIFRVYVSQISIEAYIIKLKLAACGPFFLGV